MTSRRLLYRLSLLPFAALLCAFVVACGGSPGDGSANACPGWLRGEEKQPAPARGGPGLEAAVMQAYAIAQAYYITPYNWRDGLREAWMAAERAMDSRQGMLDISRPLSDQ